ncbi:hypothetical protein BDN71DRAFT_1589488 [Pleurotus eryngii]|uniref:Uncharacterized protein n=1 Tax=Pleurotus eryngii TaxID=5323 RepID=A0A9P6A0L1_PLEER|nr:hypothetical protein BDN71DRAFT_1589488 [Pleurotus eryngii]
MFAAYKHTHTLWSRHVSTCTPTARSLVISILSNHPEGLRSPQIFEEALAKNITIDADELAANGLGQQRLPAGVPGVPYPDHPIRSMKYLKKVVLEDLKAQKLAVKFHVPNETPTHIYVNKKGKLRKHLQQGEWRWKLRDSTESTEKR